VDGSAVGLQGRDDQLHAAEQIVGNAASGSTSIFREAIRYSKRGEVWQASGTPFLVSRANRRIMSGNGVPCMSCHNMKRNSQCLCIDTLELKTRLLSGGMSEPRASAIVAASANADTGQPATKADLAEVRTELGRCGQR
jgi:hypothetical protein